MAGSSSSISKLCAICNRVIDLERYDIRPYIICPEARKDAIEAGERAFKVKNKIVIRDVDTRTIIDSLLRHRETCPGCGFNVDEATAKTSAIECNDRFPLCLNSAPIVQRYKDSDFTNIRFGVTKFRKLEPSDPILITKREPLRTGINFSPLTLAYQENPDLAPGIKLEELKKGGSDSSTAYQRLHHSTKCNGWVWRYSENEWKDLRKSIIKTVQKTELKPFTDVELEEVVYGTSELNYRELKDPKPKKDNISIFDDPIPSSGLFLGLREPTHYKKMSLAESQEWHDSRLEYRRLKYIESILHPLQPKPYEFIDPYYKDGFISRDGKIISGKTNPDYYKIDSYKKKHCGYYKYPVIFTYGRPVLESSYSSITEFGLVKVCMLKKELDFESVAPYLCLPEATPKKEPKTHGTTIAICPHESTCPIHRLPSTPWWPGQPSIWWHGVRQSVACQVYNHKKDGGILEHSEIGGFKLPIKDMPITPRAHRIYMMGRMVGGHVNQNAQTLNTKEKPKGTGRLYFKARCKNDDCDALDGVLRYGLPRWLYTKKLTILDPKDDPRYYFAGFSHGEILCDSCQTVDDMVITTTEYVPHVVEGGYDSALSDWQIFSGVKLKTDARHLNARDIKLKQLFRVCYDIGCRINQLYNSTLLQNMFRARFEYLYAVVLKDNDTVKKRVKMAMGGNKTEMMPISHFVHATRCW